MYRHKHDTFIELNIIQRSVLIRVFIYFLLICTVPYLLYISITQLNPVSLFFSNLVFNN